MKPDGYMNHKCMDMFCWNVYKYLTLQGHYEHVFKHYKHTKHHRNDMNRSCWNIYKHMNAMNMFCWNITSRKFQTFVIEKHWNTTSVMCQTFNQSKLP